MDAALGKAVAVTLALRYAETSEFLYDLEHPNAKLLGGEDLPSMERLPLLFWKTTALLLSPANLVLLLLLLSG